MQAAHPHPGALDQLASQGRLPGRQKMDVKLTTVSKALTVISYIFFIQCINLNANEKYV